MDIVTDHLTKLEQEMRATGAHDHIKTFSGEEETSCFIQWLKAMEQLQVTLQATDGRMRFITLQTLTGPAVEYVTGIINNTPNISWDTLKQLLRDHFTDLSDVLYARKTLKGLKQHSGESVQNFMQRVRGLAEEGYPGHDLKQNLLQEKLVDFFLDGLECNDMVKQLLRLRPETLDQALELAIHEQVTNKMFQLRRGPTTTTLNSIQREPRHFGENENCTKQHDLDLRLTRLEQEVGVLLSQSRELTSNQNDVPRTYAEVVQGHLFCNHCQKAGHASSSCWSKAKQTLKTNTHNEFNHGNEHIFCTHCKKVGHRSGTCWIKARQDWQDLQEFEPHNEPPLCMHCQITGHHKEQCRYKVNSIKREKHSQLKNFPERRSTTNPGLDSHPNAPRKPRKPPEWTNVGTHANTGIVKTRIYKKKNKPRIPKGWGEKIVRISPITNKSPKCGVNILGTTIEGLIDSGADLSVIQSDLLKTLNPRSILKRFKNGGPQRCVSASGHDLGPRGQIILRFALGGRQFTHKFLVVNNLHQALIIGDDFLADKGAKIDFKNRIMLVNGGRVRLTPRGPCPEEDLDESGEDEPAVNMAYGKNPELPIGEVKVKQFKVGPCSPKEDTDLMNLLQKNDDLFVQNDIELTQTDLVEMPVDTKNHHPIAQRTRRLPFQKRTLVKQHIEEMLTAGVIRPSNSPWSSPIVLAKKPDGSKRFCVDYRKLNDVTVGDAFPLPNMEDLISSIGQAKFYSSVDLKSGYWQVRMREQDKAKTAFAVPWGLYEFNVLPFGLKGGPGMFMRMMQHVLGEAQGKYCQCYIDDVVIYSSTFEEHLQHLEDVFRRIRAAGLKLKRSKCEFILQEIKFLGHVVTPTGIRPQSEKTKVIDNLEPPKTAKGVREFLGMASFYRRFVKDFSKVAKPLTNLTRKSVAFNWTTQCQEAFDSLKKALVTPPILAYPDMTKSFRLFTDASSMAVGALLTQVQDGEEKAIQYLSHQLNPAQQRYATIEKECYAIVWALDKLRHILLGTQFVIYSDHQPLKSLLTGHMKNARLQRWAITISEYGAPIEYRPGHSQKADCVSRIPPHSINPSLTDNGPCKSHIWTDDEEEDGPSEITFRDQNGEETVTINATTQPTVNDLSAEGDDWSTTTYSSSGEEGKCNQVQCLDDWSDDETYPQVDGLPRSSEPVKEEEHCYTSDYSSDQEGSASGQVHFIDSTSLPPKAAKVLQEEAGPFGAEQVQEEEARMDRAGITLKEEEVALSQLNPTMVGELQRKDKDLMPIFDAIDKGQQPKDFLIWEERLYHIAQPVRRDTHERLQLVLPEVLIPIALKLYHNEGGHLGMDRTYDLVRRRFWWDTAYRDVVLHVKHCMVCNGRNLRRLRAPMGENILPERPGEACGVDTMGPFPESRQGNRYIVHISDLFSGYPEAYPAPDKKAETINRLILERYIPSHSCMSVLLSDQGTEYVNKDLDLLSASLNIRRVKTTPYHPMTNGLTERFHDFLNKQLSKVVSTHQQDWEDHLPGILLAYRVSVHEGTKHSPFYLHHGRDATLPGDLLFGPKEKYYGEGYVPVALQRLHTSFALAKQERIHTRAVNKAYYDKKATNRTFKPGDAVYYFHPGPQVKGTSPKWKRKWQPFFRIVEQKSEHNYLIVHGPTNLTKIVHSNNLQIADPGTVWDNYYEGYGRFTEPPKLKRTGTGKCPFEPDGGEIQNNDKHDQNIRKQPLRQAKLVVSTGPQNQENQPYIWPTLPEWGRAGNTDPQEGQDKVLQRKRKSILISGPEEDALPVKITKQEQSTNSSPEEQRNHEGRVLRSAIRRRVPHNSDGNEQGGGTQDTSLGNRKRVTIDISESEPAKRIKTYDETSPVLSPTPLTGPLDGEGNADIDIDGIWWDNMEGEWGDIQSVRKGKCYDQTKENVKGGSLKNKMLDSDWSWSQQSEPCISITQGATDIEGLKLRDSRECFEGRDISSKVARFWHMLAKSMKGGRFE